MQDDPEKTLRELWDRQGVPKEKQDAIIRDIEYKASPEYIGSLFVEIFKPEGGE